MRTGKVRLFFIIRTYGKDLRFPCHIRLDEQQLWYLEMGTYKMRINLRINEVYEIEN